MGIRLRKFYIIFIISFATLQAKGATTYFDFNTSCREAYQNILSLRLPLAVKQIAKERALHPDNLIPVYLEGYIDFFQLFFNEDPQEFKGAEERWKQRALLLASGPSRSPFYKFTRAVHQFQWAAVQIKFGHNWEAGWAFRRAFMLFKENEKLFSDFTPNKLYNGSMQVAAGTIPDGYRWLSGLLGIKGSIQTGMETVEMFLKGTDEWSRLYQNEGIFYYAYLRFYIMNDKKGVLKYIKDQQLDLRSNHLFAYLATNLSINAQQSLQALEILKNRIVDAAYLKTPVWDLEWGYAAIYSLQADADLPLLRFLDQFKGKFYVKDAWQKLSWFYYLKGDQVRAEQCRKQVIKKGDNATDADKQAFKEAQSNVWPNKILLRARLLNDGGFYREGLGLLHGKQPADFFKTSDQVEFCYRAGRLFEDASNEEQALYYYAQTIRLGENRTEYFAARAALQTGMIYETKGQFPQAILWFKRCLNMEGHDYKNSLDQKAKAGLARCKGQ